MKLDLTSKDTIINVLKENNLRADKRFGQNFLINNDVLKDVVDAAELSKKDNVLEIGPGFGALTQELGKNAGLILSIEKDRNLIDWLRNYFKGQETVKIKCEDILQFLNLNYKAQIFNQIQNSNYKVVSNLPYNISSPVITKLLTRDDKPKSIVLMLQKEVAQRLVAKPGNRERGYLTVLCEFYSDAEIVRFVPKESFWPAPDVESAIIKIIPRQKDEVDGVNEKSFFRLVKIGFSQKRRQIHHPLKSGLGIGKDKVLDLLKKAGIDPAKRAEELSLEDWISLYKALGSK